LRHQLHVLERSRPRRLRLATADRWLWARLSHTWSGWRTALVIVKLETVVAWHRQGVRLFWTWKSRRRIGRPTVPTDVRALIRTMSRANSLWGAPRLHGELLKLGVDVSQATVAKYMAHRTTPPSPVVAFLPDEPSTANRRRRLLRRPNGDLPSLVRSRDSQTRAPPYRARRGYRPPGGRVDGATTPRSLSVGSAPAIPRARS